MLPPNLTNIFSDLYSFKKVFALLLITIISFIIYDQNVQEAFIQSIHHSSNTIEKNFAVFGCATPSKGATHRGFDYAFYLPLTVLAWRRIGFESIIHIIGREDEWKKHPVLNYVLDSLKKLKTSVTFLDAKEGNRMMMAQTSRIFIANMKSYPGRDNDYIITSDADLWPIRRSHYLMRENKSLHLVHSNCCGNFIHANQSYRMIPMGNTGQLNGTTIRNTWA